MNDDDFEWRYLRGGKAAHALTTAREYGALCGIGPIWGEDWQGTGNQTEYERVAELPHCMRCVRVIAVPPKPEPKPRAPRKRPPRVEKAA